MKRVLLTGASGFLGRHAIAPLRTKGFEVHAVSSRASNGVANGVTMHRADLFDATEVAALMKEVRPSHLLHFAWYAEPGKFWDSKQNYDWVVASLSLVRAFQAAGGSRVVVAGSSAEYDWKYGVCIESLTPRRPLTPYGVCKNALRELVTSLCNQSGTSFAWGLTFFLYGPYEHRARLVPSVATALIRGEIARCTAGMQIRDFMHVEDCAAAFVALLNSEVRGDVNVASGRPQSVGDLTRMVAAIVGRPELLALGALTPAVEEPPVILADVTRLLSEVGWRGARDIQYGLTTTVRWWRDELAIQGVFKDSTTV